MNKILAFILIANASVANAAEALSYQEQMQSTHITTLAATCAACHGTNGNSVNITPSLAGLDAGYFSTQMFAFKKGERSSTVMHHHAQGLNNDEINALALYFSQQKRVTAPTLPTQMLEQNHDQ
jgi:cytochrome subunit of sulfide dehydrogenase